MNGIVNKPAGANFIEEVVYAGEDLVNRRAITYNNMDSSKGGYLKIVDLHNNVNILCYRTIRTTLYFTLRNASNAASPSFHVNYGDASVDPSMGINESAECGFENIGLSLYVSYISFGRIV